MDEEEYIPIRKVCRLIGVRPQTIREWNKKDLIKTIKTPTGQTLYSRKHIQEIINSPQMDSEKENIIYARVSSKKQTDDLERQVELLRSKYSTHRVITDIGSGVNFKKKGIKTILELSIKGNIKELVVAHKDRLARFGYDLLEQFITLGGGTIVVLESCDGQKTTEQELAEDLLSIIHIYNLGKRRYKKENESSEDKSVSDNSTKEETQTMVWDQ
jgi:putative resolvase